ncbi:receptor-like protein kinase HSL1 [Lolium rigidum]|uniref:receptor-like protein kinase HSL1 n=1 Tax=Lolium rigidum TaxID=89674 RepID=UPI001F5C96CF|nr:receptor-like protein kinase HSL1 [Lolium rigidum]
MAALRRLLLPILALLVLHPLRTVTSSDAGHLLAAKHELSDPAGALSGWDARHHLCAWPHVTCAKKSTTAVAELYIYNLSIAGVFPSSLCSLRSLRRLNLAGNDIAGPLPACLADLPALSDLDLSGNYFSGGVPAAYGAGFRSLVEFKMVQNSLSGNFPAFLTNLTTLKVLQLAYNPFTPSTLPDNLGDLANLRQLYLASCNLTGKIPSSIGNLGNLGNLDLSFNRLSGEIPASVGNLSSLFQMEAYSNHLSGKIPEGLGSLKMLRNIDISMNLFTGELPADMFAGPSLESVHIYQNQLTGRLPASLGTARRLTDLRMFELVASDNSFSGRVPPSLVQLSQLFLLDLSNNSLSGEIPGVFGRFKRLTRLNLSHNHLTGIIPPEIGETSGMDMLDLSNNELSGGVPAQLQNLHPSAFNLSYNKLRGPLPRFFTASRYRESFLGNPGLCYGLCTSNADPDAIQRARINMAATILSTAAIILLIALAWFTYKYRIYKKRAAEIDCEKATWVLTSFHRVDFDEMDIVNSLDESNVIGEGAAGKVYRSVVGPRSEAVAVKKLWATTTADGATVDNSKDDDTFEAEVATLSRIRHKNIVKLFCSVTSRACRLLVYEYMPNGSLGDLLHGAKAGVLDWPARLKIAVHAAEGLCYLHHDCVPSIVHRDVKSNNILLDAEFGAKVADFGVAKTLGDEPATMSVIAGSCGYIAPEYAYTLHVTEKSDVFSFGVVILELVTGKSPMAPEIGEKDLVAWVCDTIDQNGAESVLDQKLADQFKNEMRRVLNIGLLCVNKSPNNRPPMRSVVKLLLEVQGENKPKAKKEAAPAV